MLSEEKTRAISLLSDTVLYPEAVDFMRRLVQEQECDPLPTSQVNGLLNIAAALKYSELYRFVLHQRDRNWPYTKRDIKTFYTELEKYLALMRRKRIKEEFHLLSENVNSPEADEIMAHLVHDFIQHLLAENGAIAAEQSDKKRERAGRR